MVGPLDPSGQTKWLYSPKKMLSAGQEVQGFTSAGLRQKAFFWFVVAGGNFVCHEPAISQP